jgi:hypothetical protein
MHYKKLIWLCLFPLFLFASDKKVNTKELFEYSSLQINDIVSVYAAKTNMQNFEDDKAYSIGLMHQSKDTNTDVGIGYMQPVDQIATLLDPTAFKTLSQQEDGMLFFMNYHF